MHHLLTSLDLTKELCQTRSMIDRMVIDPLTMTLATCLHQMPSKTFGLAFSYLPKARYVRTKIHDVAEDRDDATDEFSNHINT